VPAPAVTIHSASEVARPVASYEALLDVLRRRMAELDLTFDRLDDVAGLTLGHSSKILSPNPTKRLGPMSCWALLGALGLRLVVEEDLAQLARVKSRLVNFNPRNGPHSVWRRRVLSSGSQTTDADLIES